MDKLTTSETLSDKVIWHRIHHQLGAMVTGLIAGALAFGALVFAGALAAALAALVAATLGFLWCQWGRRDTLWVSGNTMTKRCVYMVSDTHRRHRFVRKEQIDLGSLVSVDMVWAHRRGGQVVRVVALGDSSGAALKLPLRWPFIGAEHWGALVLAGCERAGLVVSGEVSRALGKLGARVHEASTSSL